MFIKLISFIPLLNAFKEIKIKLYDQDIIIKFSIFRGLSITKERDYDVKMHSESLGVHIR